MNLEIAYRNKEINKPCTLDELSGIRNDVQLMNLKKSKTVAEKQSQMKSHRLLKW